MMTLAITQQEARHLVNVLQDFMTKRPDDYLEVTVEVISGTETTTADVFSKLLTFATALDAEPSS